MNCENVIKNLRAQWYLQLAFVLGSIESTGLGGTVLVLVSGLLVLLGKRSEITTAG